MGAAPTVFHDGTETPGEDETDFIGASSIRPLLIRHLTVPAGKVLTPIATGTLELSTLDSHWLEVRVDFFSWGHAAALTMPSFRAQH